MDPQRTDRRRAIVLAVLAIVALAVPLGLVARARLARSRDEAARARTALGQARDIIATAHQEKIVALAETAFAAAQTRIDQVQAALAAGAADTLPAAEAALEQARAARAEAMSRLTVARAATLKSFRNAVMYRPAEGVAWNEVRPQMSLYDRDRISTKEGAEAVVRFQEGNEMRVEENSIMVVERLVENRANATVSVTLGVPEGGVRAALGRDGDHDVRLEINLPKANVVLDTKMLKGERVEVGARVHPDQSNRVAVYTGEAEVVSPSGDKVVVHQNQYAEVTAEGKLGVPKELPSSAITLLPGRNATLYMTTERPEVTFRWKSLGSCAGYRIEAARDAAFMDKLFDEKIQRPTFTFGNFKPGHYVWRVSCVDDKGTQGAYSETSTFEVALEKEAPRLTVITPAANAVIAGDSVEARCKTSPGISVFINGQEAKGHDGGVYTQLVKLTPGLNTLVFEAIDPTGNVIYNSRLVTRQP